MASGLGDRTVIFEHVRLGSAAKVVAVDEKTGLEVAVVVPAHLPQAAGERLAAQKLASQLHKRALL